MLRGPRTTVFLAVLLLAFACAQPDGATSHPRRAEGEPDRASHSVRVGHVECPRLSACVELVRHALGATTPTQAFLKAVDGVLALDGPVGAWLYATPPGALDVVAVLPLRTEDPRKALRELGIPVETVGGMKIGGRPARIVGDRLFIGTQEQAVRAAAKGGPPAVSTGPSDALLVGELDIDAVPAEIRSAWLARVDARVTPRADGSRPLDPVARFGSWHDVLRDGARLRAHVKPLGERRQELAITVTPRAGSWLEAHVQRNTKLTSRLAALVPDDSRQHMSWIEVQALRDEDRKAAVAGFDEIEKRLERMPHELGFPPGLELEVVPLLQDAVELAQVVLEDRQFDYVAFVPREVDSLVVGVTGVPKVRVDGVLTRAVATLKRHPLDWISSVGSKRRGKHTIHELVMETPADLQPIFGASTSISLATTSGDTLLVVAQSKEKKARMPALLDALGRGKAIPATLRDAKLDLARVTRALVQDAGELQEWLIDAPGEPVLDWVTRVEDGALVGTVQVDIDAWLDLLLRTGVVRPLAAPH